MVNKSGSTLAATTPVYVTGHDGTNVEIDAFTPDLANPVLGLLKTSTTNNSVGIVVITGILSGVNTSAFSEGATLYVAASGGLDDTSPAGGSPAIGIVAYADTSNGIVIIGAKGSPTWASLKSGL